MLHLIFAIFPYVKTTAHNTWKETTKFTRRMLYLKGTATDDPKMYYHITSKHGTFLF